MAIKSIELRNFTVFENINISFSSGINIFIGENGTGKTHLLKAVYSFCKADIDADGVRETSSLNRVIGECFGVELEQLRNVHVKSSSMPFIPFDDKDKESYNAIAKALDALKPEYEITMFHKDVATTAIFAIDSNIYPFHWSISSPRELYVGEKEDGFIINKNSKQPLPSIYIPAKDMLTHGGLEKDYIDRNLPFDTTLIDILNKAGVSTKKNLDNGLQSILDKIASTIGGKIVYSNDKYYINRETVGSVEFAIEAEGYKKLGLIYRLIETGYISQGSVLIWDEPETNLNPKLIPIVVDILLELSRNGVQIFLATHDYVISKYFEVRQHIDDNILFHSLYKSESNVNAENNVNFRNLKNNPIITAFDVLMDEVINRNMGD